MKQNDTIELRTLIYELSWSEYLWGQSLKIVSPEMAKAYSLIDEIDRIIDSQSLLFKDKAPSLNILRLRIHSLADSAFKAGVDSKYFDYHALIKPINEILESLQ